MSFADWVKNGWLVAHKSSKREMANLLGIVARNNYILTLNVGAIAMSTSTIIVALNAQLLRRLRIVHHEAKVLH